MRFQTSSNVGVSIIYVMSLGRLLQDAGPEYDKARSPILRRRAGSSYMVLADDLSRLRLADALLVFVCIYIYIYIYIYI